MDEQPFTHLEVDVDGPVHLLDLGGPPRQEHPATVLVHGLDGSAANWVDAGPGLTRRRRTLAVDLPGFGRTPLRSRRVDLPGVADHLAGVLDRLDLGPVELVGNSWGGPVALWAAARHPHLVARVVLVAPGGADPIIPATSVARALDRHPAWTHACLPGAGHVPQLEDPPAFVAALDEGRVS